MISRFGENYNRVIQSRITKTLQDRYGVDKLHQVNSGQRAATNLERYGSPTPLQSPEIQARTRESLAANLGIRFPFQSQAIQQEIQQQWVHKTGKKSYAKTSSQILANQVKHLEQKFGSKAQYLLDKNLFVEQLRTKSRTELAFFLGCSDSLIDKRIAEWDLTEFQEGKSHYETVISNFLTKMGVEYDFNTRKLISPQEIDWWLPQHNLGIEFCGLRWHGERVGRDKWYHLAKLQKMNFQGHGLIQIFQDEWDQKSHIVKSIIKNRLRLSQSQHVMARKCQVVELSQKQLQDFLSQNHLYGATKGDRIRLGLIHEKTLVAAMSFRRHKQSEWEISRFATLCDHNVSGGFSKLFAHFQKLEMPKEVISYVDLRYFSGHSLSATGFEFAGSTMPGYHYTKGVLRYHRLNFTKSRLVKQGFDASKTEQEIMIERQYDRIWDCGHDRWIWNSKNKGTSQ
jgi:hypothetical protein